MDPQLQENMTIALWRIRQSLVEADLDLEPFRHLKVSRSSWLRFARQSLLFSTGHIAHHLGVSRAAYFKMEERELSGQISLALLRKAAHALDCELVYAIRPLEGKSFAESSWKRVASLVEARLPRYEMPPQRLVFMKMALATDLLESQKNRGQARVKRGHRGRKSVKIP